MNISVLFFQIKEYVSNTHAETHGAYSLQVEQIYDLERENEDSRFKPVSLTPHTRFFFEKAPFNLQSRIEYVRFGKDPISWMNLEDVENCMNATLKDLIHMIMCMLLFSAFVLY